MSILSAESVNIFPSLMLIGLALIRRSIILSEYATTLLMNLFQTLDSIKQTSLPWFGLSLYRQVPVRFFSQVSKF